MTGWLCRLVGHKFGGLPRFDLPGARLPVAFCARCGRTI